MPFNQSKSKFKKLVLKMKFHLLLPREQEESQYEASWVPRVEFYGSWASGMEFLKKRRRIV